MTTNTFTPFNDRKDSNIDMLGSSSNININTYSQYIPQPNQARFLKLIALGNPIVDISAEISKDSVIVGGYSIRRSIQCRFL